MARKNLVITYTLLAGSGILGLWLMHLSKENSKIVLDSDWLSIIGSCLLIIGMIGFVIVDNRRPMREKDRQAWEKTKAKGKRRYVMWGTVRGVLLLSLISLPSLYKAIRSGEFFNAPTAQIGVEIFVWLFFLFIFIGAAVAGWDEQEKKYNESLKESRGLTRHSL